MSLLFIKKRQLNSSTKCKQLVNFQKTDILFVSDWLSNHVDGGGTCGKARIGADVPENFKSTLNDVERNILTKWKWNMLEWLYFKKKENLFSRVMYQQVSLLIIKTRQLNTCKQQTY